MPTDETPTSLNLRTLEKLCELQDRLFAIMARQQATVAMIAGVNEDVRAVHRRQTSILRLQQASFDAPARALG
jgi:hypothetical protein